MLSQDESLEDLLFPPFSGTAQIPQLAPHSKAIPPLAGTRSPGLAVLLASVPIF